MWIQRTLSLMSVILDLVFYLIKQLFNEVVTKSMKMEIFRWWAPFNQLIFCKNELLEGFKGQMWIQPVLSLISVFLDLISLLSNYIK